VDASSGVSDLNDEITKTVEREYELLKYSRLWYDYQDKTASHMAVVYGLAYYKIQALEESLRRYRAKNVQDLDTEWQGLVRGQIDAQTQLAKVESDLYIAQNERVKDAQKIKDLQLQEASTRDLIWRLEKEQLSVEYQRGVEAAKQDAVLAKQLDFAIRQSQQASELSDKYRQMAGDQTLSFEDREKYAKLAEQYGQKTIDSARDAAKYDSERAKLAKLTGDDYKDQQDAIQKLADKGMKGTTDALEEQKKLTDERIAKLDEEKKKWEDNAARYKELITEVQGKYQWLLKQLERIGVGHDDWYKKASDMIGVFGQISDPIDNMTKLMLDFKDALEQAKQKASELNAEMQQTVATEAVYVGGLLRGVNQKFSSGSTWAAGVRGATGRLVPARVTAGEGLFLPSIVQKYYSRLAQINSGANLALGFGPNATFRGGAGIDTIRTMVPEGSYIMSLRGMNVLGQAADDLRQASISARSMGYQGGGIVESAPTTKQNQMETIGVINVKISNGDEEMSLPVVGTHQKMIEITRFLKRERLTKARK